MPSLRMRIAAGAATMIVAVILAAPIASATQLLRVSPIDKGQYIHLLQVAPEARDDGAMTEGAVVEFPAAEGRADELSALGFRVEIAVPSLEEFYAARLGYARDYGGYHTYTTAILDMDALAAAHPAVMSQKFSIGTTIEGRPIWVYKISSSPNEDNGLPEIFFNAYIHAREAITFEVAYDLASYLVSGYGSDPRATNIVDTRQIYIQPVVNPDGVEYNALTSPNGGGMWRKNRRDNGDGSFGIDLNRNFGFQWGYDDEGSSPIGSDETYRGTGPFSEPETQAMRDFVNAHRFAINVNLHSYGRYELFSWGYETLHPPDYEILFAIGRLHRSTSGYNTGSSWENLYQVNGGADDWFYGEQTSKPKVFSFVSEIGTGSDGFWPLSSRIPALKAENREANLRYCELADNPERILPPGWALVSAPDTVSTSFTLAWTVPVPDPDNPATEWNLIQATGATVGADDLEGTNPTRWMADGWTLSAARSHSATHSFYSGDLNSQNDVLVSRRGHQVQPGEAISFWTWYQLESDWDYGYVEVSTNGREFATLPGTITTTSDPNNRNLSYGITGASGGWVQASFSLSSYVGQVVWLRFRYNSDGYYTDEGWYVDDIEPADLFATETVFASGWPNNHMSFSGYPTGTYQFLVQAVDADGDEAVWGPPEQVTVMDLAGIAESEPAPWRGLESAGANPFHDSVVLRFTVPSSCGSNDPITLTVHDVTGRRVATILDTTADRGFRPGEVVENAWIPRNTPAGVYLARLTIGGTVAETKLTLIR